MMSTVIVTPYFEDPACAQFCQALSQVFDKSMRLVIIDDGSVDRVLTASDFTDFELQGEILRLRRNLGHQAAISVGIDYATKNYDFETLIILDSDGEDRPSDIPVLTKTLQNISADVVVAKRKSRHETIRFKLFYAVYQLFFRLMVGRSISFGSFMAMNVQAAKRLAASQETALHVAASALNSRLRIYELPLDRGIRYAGRSSMNLVTLVLHGLRSIMVFAEQVIVRITLLCLAIAALVFCGLLAMLIMKFAGATIPGWYSTGSGLLMLLLFQIGSMAVLVLLSADRVRGRSSKSLNYETVVSKVIPLK